MAHGQPDFGMYRQKATVFGLSDMAELAVRLGSIVSYDRRGDVVFIEDFTGGLTRCTLTGGGTGYSVTTTNEKYLTRGVSCKLVNGSDGSKNAGIQIYFSTPISSRIGQESSFALGGYIERVRFNTRINTNNEYNYFGVQYNASTNVLEYIDSDGNWVDLNYGIALYSANKPFHSIKLVGDFVTNKYVRLLLDDYEKDLSGIDCYTVAEVGYPYAWTAVSVYHSAGANIDTYVDNVILTQNEP